MYANEKSVSDQLANTMMSISPAFHLDDGDLWQKFNMAVNEMIVTKSGR